MATPEDDADKTTEEKMKSEITARQIRENQKMQQALKEQRQWRDLIED